MGLSKFQHAFGKLDMIISYQEDADFEVEKVGLRIRLSILTYLEHKKYYINCNELTTSKRPYNTSELSDIILNVEAKWQDQNKQITTRIKTLNEIENFFQERLTQKAELLSNLQTKQARQV